MTALGTCPQCGLPFGSSPAPGQVEVWAIHKCPGTPQQQAAYAAEQKRRKAQEKGKPR